MNSDDLCVLKLLFSCSYPSLVYSLIVPYGLIMESIEIVSTLWVNNGKLVLACIVKLNRDDHNGEGIILHLISILFPRDRISERT